MGSLTVLAGLMFTLGTRPVNAYDYYNVINNPKSPLSRTEEEFKKTKEKVKSEIRDENIKEEFKNRIDSSDDYSKLRALKEEAKVAEADKISESEFEKKLATLKPKIEKLTSKHKKKMLDGHAYLTSMKDDAYFSNYEKLKRLADLERCLTTPRDVQRLRWINR